MRARLLLGATALFFLVRCAPTPQRPAAPTVADAPESALPATPPPAAEEGPKETPVAAASTPRERERPPRTYEPPPLTAFPKDIVFGRPLALAVPGDRPLRVSHASREIPGAIVYLHGMCSDPYGADPWIAEALAYGTFISVRADVPCEDRPGYKWPKDPTLIQARIERALEIVRAARGGALDLREVTLIGYSQGANRAELLASLRPDLYRRLVLGGPPTAALPENFRVAQRVAFLGGEREDATHMRNGQLALRDAGLDTRFFLLPKAPHGSYGPEGRHVMNEVLGWLYRPLENDGPLPGE